MQLQKPSSEKVNFSNNFESYDCSFDNNDNGYMATLLRDSIYSNKELAAIRETTTNAVDAHIEAGIPEKPIHVTLPTLSDPSFICRDFGNGISFENMSSIYGIFGKSTKRELDFKSENQAGCFGIGRFAPLCIEGNDSFAVRSFQNGRVGVYEVRINEENNNSIIKIGEFDTQEGNGLEISFTIDSSDIENFNNIAKECFKNFDIHPFITNNQDYKPLFKKYEIEKYFDKHSFYKVERGTSSNKIVMANISYKFDQYDFLEKISKNIEEEKYNKIKKLLNEFSVYLKVKPGEISFPPSRENVSLDRKTCRNLCDYFYNIYLSIVDDYKEEISKAKTLRDAMILAQKISVLNTNIFWECCFNNVRLEFYRQFFIRSKVYYTKYSPRSKKNYILKNRSEHKILFSKNDKFIIVNNDSKNLSGRMRKFLLEDRNYSYEIYFIEDRRELYNLFNLVGGKEKLGFETKLLSEFEKPTIERSKNNSFTGYSTQGVQFFKLIHGGEKAKEWAKPLEQEEISEINKKQEKIYIPTKYFKPTSKADELYDYYNIFGELDFSDDVYIIREKDIKNLDSTWKSADEKIIELINKNKNKIRKLIISETFGFEIEKTGEIMGLLKFYKIIKINCKIDNKKYLSIIRIKPKIKTNGCYYNTSKYFYSDFPKIKERNKEAFKNQFHKNLDKIRTIINSFSFFKYFEPKKESSFEFFQKNKEIFAQMVEVSEQKS